MASSATLSPLLSLSKPTNSSSSLSVSDSNCHFLGSNCRALVLSLVVYLSALSLFWSRYLAQTVCYPSILDQSVPWEKQPDFSERTAKSHVAVALPHQLVSILTAQHVWWLMSAQDLTMVRNLSVVYSLTVKFSRAAQASSPCQPALCQHLGCIWLICLNLIREASLGTLKEAVSCKQEN